MSVKIPKSINAHIPSILIYHVADSLHVATCDFTIKPKVSFVHGTLLFVDISGFTALSTKVAPDVLKTHINGYFSTIIEIISKYHGDIVKFAGDALFALWVHGNDKKSTSRHCVKLAIECAQEINLCCDGKVLHLKPDHQFDFRKCTSFESIEGDYSLHVHSGISCGLLGGVHVGFEDRWEFFLIGAPVEEVGKATDQANAGDVVVSSSVYREVNEGALMWSFEPLKEGYMRVNNCGTADTQQLILPFSSKLEHGMYATYVEILQRSFVITDIGSRLVSVFLSHVNEAARVYDSDWRGGIDPLVGSDEHAGLGGGGGGEGKLVVDAELRTVVTIFIKVNVRVIDGLQSTALCLEGEPKSNTGRVKNEMNPEVLESCHQHSTGVGIFVHRSAVDAAKDRVLLDHLQASMEVFVTSLKAHGGQLRQFIVDDKGCVAIGSFGLRKAVTRDNCASAVQCSYAMMNGLKKINLDCSIGVTVGKAFCGLIGSDSRHEYGVMGRSVNLAARLMVAAPMGYVLCDRATKAADMLHSYVELAEVKAKGYVTLVTTFRPVEYVDCFSLLSDPSKLSPSTEPLIPFVSSLSRHKDGFFGRFAELLEVNRMVEQHRRDGNRSAQLVVVYGGHGSGKSSFLDYLALSAKALNTCSGHFRGRASAGDSVTPFLVWKKIVVTSLLARLMQVYASRDSDVSQQRPISVALGSDVGSSSEQGTYGAFCRLLSTMSDEFTAETAALLRAVLFHKKLTAVEAAIIAKLSSAQKLQRSVGALAKLIQSCVDLIQCDQPLQFAIISIVDMEHIDFASWQLLKYLYVHGRDILLLATVEQPGEGDLMGPHGSLKALGQPAVLTPGPAKTCSADIGIEIGAAGSGAGAGAGAGAGEGVRPIDSLKGDQLDIDDAGDASSETSSSLSVASFSRSSLLKISLETIVSDLKGMYSTDSTRMIRLHLGRFHRAAVDNFVRSILGSSFPQHRLPDPLTHIDNTTVVAHADAEVEAEANKEMEAKTGHEETSSMQKVLDLVSDISRGNPLHIREVLAAASLNCSSIDELHSSLQNISVHSLRMEELILFQLDKLSDLCTTLLKAASVFGCFGTSFTPDTLFTFLVSEQETVDGDGDDDMSYRGSHIEFDRPHNIYSREQRRKVSRTVTLDDVIHSVHKILSESHIIEIVSRLDEGSDNDSVIDDIDNLTFKAVAASTAAEGIGSTTELRYVSELKRATIYNLMLPDQQEERHSRVAAYLEAIAITQPTSLTAATWQLQGYHWQSGRVWAKAFASYYEAAMLLSDMGSLQDAKGMFCRSHTMLQAMKHGAGIAVDYCFTVENEKCVKQQLSSDVANDNLRSRSSSESGAEVHAGHGHIRNSTRTEDGDGDGEGGDEDDVDEDDLLRKAVSYSLLSGTKDEIGGNSRKEKRKWTLAEVHTVCAGDVLALELACLMLIRFFQCLLTSSDMVEYMSLLLDEALELILTTRKGNKGNKGRGNRRGDVIAGEGHSRCMNRVPTSCLSPILHRGLDTSRTGDPLSPPASEVHSQYSSYTPIGNFGLRNVSVIFPVLAGFAMQLQARIVPDDLEMSNFGRICSIFLTMAEDYGDPVHILRALAFYEKKHEHTQRFADSIASVDYMLSLYSVEEHSQRMTAIYLSDRAIAAIASSVSHRLLVGDWSSAAETARFVHGAVRRFTHLYTVAQFSLYMVKALFTLNMFDAALEHFLYNFRLDLAASQEFSLFRALNPFTLECLLRKSSMSPEQRDELRDSLRPHAWQSSLQLLGADGSALPIVRSQPTIIQEAVSIGCDCAKAHICLSIACQLVATLSRTSPSLTSSSSLSALEFPFNYNDVIDKSPPYVETATAVQWCCAGLTYAQASIAATTIHDTQGMNRLHCLWVKAEILTLLSTMAEQEGEEGGWAHRMEGIDFDSGQRMAAVDPQYFSGEKSTSTSATDCLSPGVKAHSDAPLSMQRQLRLLERITIRQRVFELAARHLEMCADVGHSLNSSLILLRTGLLKVQLTNAQLAKLQLSCPSDSDCLAPDLHSVDAENTSTMEHPFTGGENGAGGVGQNDEANAEVEVEGASSQSEDTTALPPGQTQGLDGLPLFDDSRAVEASDSCTIEEVALRSGLHLLELALGELRLAGVRNANKGGSASDGGSSGRGNSCSATDGGCSGTGSGSSDDSSSASDGGCSGTGSSSSDDSSSSGSGDSGSSGGDIQTQELAVIQYDFNSSPLVEDAARILTEMKSIM